MLNFHGSLNCLKVLISLSKPQNGHSITLSHHSHVTAISNFFLKNKNLQDSEHARIRRFTATNYLFSLKRILKFPLSHKKLISS